MLKTAVYTFSLLILFIVGGCATPIANEPDISEEQISSFQLKAVKEFDRLEALSDPENRVSREFDISEGLKPRVHFWFNVYTKYGSSDHVIHHSRYPWIVFKVINTEEIEKSSLHKWTKYHRIRKLVAQERKSIRKTLQKLSRRRSYKKLSPLEKQLFDRLKWVRGKRQNVFKFASQHVRSQLGQRDFYVQGLEHSHQFLPFMEEEFQAQNLPKELTRIPFVESSFNVRAESSVGASGIWQIMPRIGSSYGIVGRYIDERNSPYKATSIASKLLRFNYRSLKSWPLAVTAYNNGIGGTRKAVRKTQTSDLAKIIRKHYKGSFKFASANFYSSFLAALYAYEYRREIFNVNGNRKPPATPLEKISLDQRFRPLTLLKITKLTKEEFLNYNLDLKRAMAKNVLLPKKLKIFLPKDAAENLKTHIALADRKVPKKS